MNNIGTGLVAVAIAVFFFGSNFVPIKRYKTGDGMFFQWALCIGIWHVGLCVNIIRGQPEFQPIAMCGGLIWATGNLLTVPIVQRIGLAMGLLIWGATNLIGGWLSGVIGLMGIKKETGDISSWPLNYVGIVLGLVSMAIASFVRPNVKSQESYDNCSTMSLLQNVATIQEGSLDGEIPYKALQGKEMEPTSNLKDRMTGVLLSIIAGLCYGINFDPPQYVIDNYPGVSHSNIDYVFSHFCGILLASTFWFCMYCAYKNYHQELIQVYPKVILPGIVSGAMWGIAATACFVANEELDFVVSFPLVSLGPGFIGFLWDVFLFKEIQGFRNYCCIGVVFITAASCAVCIVFSRL